MVARAGPAWASSFVLLLAAIIVLLSSSCASAFETLDLNSADWKITNKNGSIEIGSVQLPSYPVEELRKLGLIQDPQYRCVLGPWQAVLDAGKRFTNDSGE